MKSTRPRPGRDCRGIIYLPVPVQARARALAGWREARARRSTARASGCWATRSCLHWPRPTLASPANWPARRDLPPALRDARASSAGRYLRGSEALRRGRAGYRQDSGRAAQDQAAVKTLGKSPAESGRGPWTGRRSPCHAPRTGRPAAGRAGTAGPVGLASRLSANGWWPRRELSKAFADGPGA